MDYMTLLPETYSESQFLNAYIGGVGSQFDLIKADIEGILGLLNPNTVPLGYMSNLAALVNLKLLGLDSYEEYQIRRQLVQVVDWYKLKGTYQSLIVTAYFFGLSLEIKDLWTDDYATFVPIDWYVEDEGGYPLGLDETYYKSPHFGCYFLLNSVKYRIPPTNLLNNGDFENWTLGDAVAPDDWTLFGSDAAVAKESTIKKFGNYSAKLTRNGTNCYFYQDVHAALGIDYWKGKTVTFGCWVKASVASRAFIGIYDGVTSTYSTGHTGSGDWEWLTSTKVISESATMIQARLRVATGDTNAYFDGAIAVEGADFEYDPLTGEIAEKYLFDSSNFLNFKEYVEEVRPVNTVPHYYLKLSPITTETKVMQVVPGDIKALVTDNWTYVNLYFDDGNVFDDSDDFDSSLAAFFNSLTIWKLGTGNKNGTPLSSMTDLDSIVLSGTINNTVSGVEEGRNYHEFQITLEAVTQEGLSELGLYLDDETTLVALVFFPNLNINEEVTLYINFRIYVS